MTAFQLGDRVRHNPTGEGWVLVQVYGSYVVPGGFHPVRSVLASDCTLIARDDGCTCATSDEQDACTCTTLVEQNACTCATSAEQDACTKSCDAVLL